MTNNKQRQTKTNDKQQQTTNKTIFWMHIMKADHLDTWTTWTTLTNWSTLTILTDQWGIKKIIAEFALFTRFCALNESPEDTVGLSLDPLWLWIGIKDQLADLSRPICPCLSVYWEIKTMLCRPGSLILKANWPPPSMHFDVSRGPFAWCINNL